MRNRHETWRGMRWTQMRCRTSSANADDKAVWSWSPDAGIKLAKMMDERRWLQSPVHRGERGISRKPSRRECRIVRRTCGDLLACFFQLHARLRVRLAPGIPCALRFPRGANDAKPGRNHAAGRHNRGSIRVVAILRDAACRPLLRMRSECVAPCWTLMVSRRQRVRAKRGPMTGSAPSRTTRPVCRPGNFAKNT